MMKRNSFIFLMGTVLVLIFSACKKDKNEEKSTSQMLQGVWNFQKEYYHENYGGIESRDTTIGVTGEYADFRTDGKVYFFSSNGNDTLAYSVIGNDKVVTTYTTSSVTFNDTATIQVLNDHEMQLYTKEFNPAPDYYEYTTFYTK